MKPFTESNDLLADPPALRKQASFQAKPAATMSSTDTTSIGSPGSDIKAIGCPSNGGKSSQNMASGITGFILFWPKPNSGRLL